jgi:AhpD family alkylhydroperoxidase
MRDCGQVNPASPLKVFQMGCNLASAGNVIRINRLRRKEEMDEKTKILISLGASAAANCIPCFEHHHGKALRTGLTHGEIEEAVEVAMQVKNGAHLTTRRFIDQTLEKEGASPSPCCAPASSCCQ